MNQPLYDAVNPAVFAWVPVGAKRILDVGCGTGALGEAIKKRQSTAFVLGVTHSAEEAALARVKLDDALVQEVETLDVSTFPPFDCIIASHVLEHVADPEKLLKRLQTFLVPGGQMLIALPNVLHWRQRGLFLRGRFEYTEGGLMDRTHLRFFDHASARALLAAAGLRVMAEQTTGNFPLPGIRSLFPALAQRLDAAALAHWPGLFGFQFVFRCVKDLSKERA